MGYLFANRFLQSITCLIEIITQNQHNFLAHVCNEVPGTPMHFDYKDHALYYRWGQKLAKLHSVAQIFSPKPNAPLFYWHESFDEMKSYLDNEPDFVTKELANVHQQLKKMPHHKQNYGMTHGDHRKGNVLCDGKRIHIIDFDTPRYHWFMEDIARPFFSAFIQNQTNWQDKLKPYLEGYQSAFPIEKNDLSYFPCFIRLKALEIYLWTKNNWTSDFAPGGATTQDWLRMMETSIEHPDQINQAFSRIQL